MRDKRPANNLAGSSFKLKRLIALIKPAKNIRVGTPAELEITDQFN